MPAAAQALVKLSEEFWDWRIKTQPDSQDDVPRVERSAGWSADWSADAIAGHRQRLAEFSACYRSLDLTGEPVAIQVNGRLLSSALARVHWELELLRNWQRNPCFYLDQSLVPIFNLLLPAPPFGPERAAAIIRRVRNVPSVLEQGRANLAGHASHSFGRYALRLLATGIGDVQQAMDALVPLLPQPQADELPAVTSAAAESLRRFRSWLGDQAFVADTAVGPTALRFFLHQVALLPYPARTIRAIGRHEFNRAVTIETILPRGKRQPSLLTLAELIARQHADELDVRRFYTRHRILSQPSDLRHYRFAPMPPYLMPLTWLGIPHDATSPARARHDATRYVTSPGPNLPYFAQAKATDPRTGIVHEGVHAQQLALSWQHPDPARRHYYDSAPNEGIAFYNEELMLLSGLFRDAPASAAFIANSMRLRALRAEIDIALALGELSVGQAADRLSQTIPLDQDTAWQEAVFFAANPGLGLSYQIGKTQITELLAACVRHQAGFSRQGFHDRLWLEGNVPITLQRWELLNLPDHLAQADKLGRSGSLGYPILRSRGNIPLSSA